MTKKERGNRISSPRLTEVKDNTQLQRRAKMKLSWDAFLLVAGYIDWDSWDAFICVSHQITLLSQDERLWRLRMIRDFPDQTLPSNERCYRFLQELRHHALNYHRYLDNTLQEMIEKERFVAQEFGCIASPLLLEGENDSLLPLTFPLCVTMITFQHEPKGSNIDINIGRTNGLPLFSVGMSLIRLYVAQVGNYYTMLNVIKERIGGNNILLPISFVCAYPDFFRES